MAVLVVARARRRGTDVLAVQQGDRPTARTHPVLGATAQPSPAAYGLALAGGGTADGRGDGTGRGDVAARATRRR